MRFININVAEFDSYKHRALPLTGDARVTLEELSEALRRHTRVNATYQTRIDEFRDEWEKEVDRIYGVRKDPPITQGEVIGVVNEMCKADRMSWFVRREVCRAICTNLAHAEPGNYHMEYGYSCMGYEIAGGLGIKMANPEREVYVMVGDGSYLMMAQEIVTSLQEGYKLMSVLLDNHGFSSIGGLSRGCGNEGMGTNYRYRRGENYDGDFLPVDFQANAASLGAWSVRARTSEEFRQALSEAKKQTRTSVVVVETSYEDRVPGYESWWDVPIAEVSERDAVKAARRRI